PTVSPTSFSFVALKGQTRSVSNVLSVFTNGNQMDVSATASGGSWLSVNPPVATAWSFDAPTVSNTAAQFTIAVNPTGLAQGTYTGSIRIAPQTGGFAPTSVPVTLSLRSSDLLVTQSDDGGK